MTDRARAHPWKDASGTAEAYLGDIELKARIAEGHMRRWEPIWAASGIGHAFRTLESLLDWPSPRTDASLTLAVPVGTDLVPGDLAALRDGEVPTEANQHLRRAVSLEPSVSSPGMLVATFGPPLDRSDWPQAMRAVTAPTALSVRVVDASVQVLDGAGGVVSSFPVKGDGIGMTAHHVGGFVTDMAELGRTDGLEGRRRSLALRAGRGGKGLSGATWQIVDEAGTVHAAEARSFLQRRAPDQVAAMLAGGRAAYLDGMLEARSALFERIRDDDPDAPSMWGARP